MWNFEIYTSKETLLLATLRALVDDASRPIPGDARLAHNVMFRLVDGLWDRGHCLTVDNFFISIELFDTLLSCGMFACGTVRANRVGLPVDLENIAAYKNAPEGITL